VSLLQVIPGVCLIDLEAGRLLLLFLHESLEFHLLLLLEILTFQVLEFLHMFFLLPVNLLYFLHETLDLVNNLVSVGLINVGTEADLPITILRYWSNSEHGECFCWTQMCNVCHSSSVDCDRDTAGLGPGSVVQTVSVYV